MKIAMIGSGAAGSVFACYLRRGGAELYLVDRYKAHMDKIAAEGMSFREPGCECLLKDFHTAACASELPLMDIVILMVKATQTDGIMPEVMACVGPETVLVSLQNGLGNDDILAKYVPRDRIMFGAGVIGTELAAPGVCVAKPEDGVQMFFGAVEKGRLTDRAGQYLEDCFRSGGCKASFEDDVRTLLWKKAVTNSGYNAVCTVTRLKVREVMDDEFGMALMEQIWREGCAVALAAGVGDIWPLIDGDRENLRANLGDYYPSMAQDAVIHGRQTEISFLNGAIARYGESLGVPTPANSVLARVIEAIQNNLDRQYKQSK
ncbi:MAG: 2-dehydropantoate 2-reductase [Oscillospiraceae bacterium]